jgi:hypothetical protein
MGIVGALLALPVAAAIRMLIHELRIELPGERLHHDEVLARDELAEREYARRADGVPAVAAAAIAVEISEERRQSEKEAVSGAENLPLVDEAAKDR